SVAPWKLDRFETESRNGNVRCRARLLRNGKPVEISGEGNGPLAALVHGFTVAGVPRFEITHYSEHALSSGEEAPAIAYIQIKDRYGKARWGAGVDTNIELASVRAVLSALNRSQAKPGDSVSGTLPAPKNGRKSRKNAQKSLK